jgi:CspA family cold shock protein
MSRGTVQWFNSQKGYGFIQPQGGGKDVFVHISAVEKAGLSGLNEGQVVEYEEVANKGKTSAETRRATGDAAASLNDYDGKTLGQLGPQVEPLLTNEPSHLGKLRAIGGAVNPAKAGRCCASSWRVKGSPRRFESLEKGISQTLTSEDPSIPLKTRNYL